METISERRTRKLVALAETKGGVAVIASDCGLSAAALDQIVKGTLLPTKKDGTRSKKALGNDAARAIEDRYGLGRGWFDAADEEMGESPAEPEAQLLTALRVIAEAIRPTSTIVRDALVPTFSNLVRSPEEVGTISQTIQNLIQSAPRQTQEADNGPRSSIKTSLNISGKLGQQRHGQRIRVSAGKK